MRDFYIGRKKKINELFHIIQNYNNYFFKKFLIIHKNRRHCCQRLRDPAGTRTQNPQLRRLMLYPVELPNLTLFCGAKVVIFWRFCKYFASFLLFILQKCFVQLPKHLYFNMICYRGAGANL